MSSKNDQNGKLSKNKNRICGLILCFLVVIAVVIGIVVISSSEKCPKLSSSICITTDDGRERCWLKYVPKHLQDKNLSSLIPMVVILHGYEQCASSLGYTKWYENANDNDFMLVFPQGLEKIEGASDGQPSWNAGSCCGGAMEKQIDDVSFVRSLVEKEIKDETNNIDTSKVYIAGYSNGCALAQRVAVEHSDLFAAVGCHSMYLLVDAPSSYEPIPFITVHGEKDEEVPYSKGVLPDTTIKIPGAVENIKKWSEINECDMENPIVEVKDEYKTTSYTNCTNNANTTLISVPSAGHVPFKDLHQPNVFDTSTPKLQTDTVALVWNFINEFSKDNTTTTSSDAN